MKYPINSPNREISESELYTRPATEKWYNEQKSHGNLRSNSSTSGQGAVFSMNKKGPDEYNVISQTGRKPFHFPIRFARIDFTLNNTKKYVLKANRPNAKI